MSEHQTQDRSVECDLVIRGGVVYSPAGHYPADIGVRDGRISDIAAAGEQLHGRTVVDARGLAVLPGIWHAHCHFRDPGHTNKEDFESGTRAAAAGGITFCLDQPNTSPPPVDLDTFEEKKAVTSTKAHVDFGLNGGGLIPGNVAALAGAGAMSIKAFNTRHPKDVYPYIPELGVIDRGLLYEIYEATADAGIVMSVHHDDADWSRRMVRRDYIDKGLVSNADYMEAYERGYMYGHGMVAGLAASLHYAQLAGTRLYVLHLGVMPVEAYNLIRRAKEDGHVVYAELEATAMLMDRAQAERIGPFTYLWAHTPEEAWRSLHDGTADVLVMEHAPHTREEVEPGWTDNFSVPLGVTGAQEFLPMILSQINAGRMTLEQLVHLSSEQPAKIFGVYPQKGAILPGSDADFTIVDMNANGVLTAADMHSKVKLTSWEGKAVSAMPVYTIVRGAVIMDHGKILSEPGYGRFTPGGLAHNGQAVANTNVAGGR